MDRLRITGLDTRAYRQKGSGNGLNKGDIWNDLNISFEAKNQKTSKIKEWMKQSEADSLGTTNPVVVWHPPQVPLEDSLVIIKWPYFEDLLAKSKSPEMKEPDRQVAWKIKNTIVALKALLKELE